jgi:phenylpropionate dioxygenase-like ring-hydroxylating dioxygenase large terminal subunit
MTYRYPFTPYPESWFRVAFSDEVKAVHPVHCLGRKLLLFRGDDGVVQATSAVCPHLGADLSLGRVAGNEIECPFHGWKFDGSGACTQIPYCDNTPPKARLTTFAVREVNGMIFVANGFPDFELPAVDTRGWSKPHRLRWKIRMHVQEIIENAVDLGHFAHVHAYRDYPRNPALTVEGHRFRVSIESDRRVLGLVSDTAVEITYHGMGMAVARIRSKRVELLALLTPTPIDEEYLDVSLWIYFKKTGNPLLDLVTSIVVPRDIKADFANDIPIWENKQYLTHPVLCGGDGPIRKVRRWAEQFYATPSVKRLSLLGTGG